MVVGLFPQEISCKFDMAYIENTFVNIGMRHKYEINPKMYPLKFLKKSIGLITIGTK